MMRVCFQELLIFFWGSWSTLEFLWKDPKLPSQGAKTPQFSPTTNLSLLEGFSPTRSFFQHRGGSWNFPEKNPKGGSWSSFFQSQHFFRVFFSRGKKTSVLVVKSNEKPSSFRKGSWRLEAARNVQGWMPLDGHYWPNLGFFNDL